MAINTDEKIRILPVGDSALMVEFGQQIDLVTNGKVHALAGLLAQTPREGIGEAVPAYASLLVHYDPLLVDYANMKALVIEQLDGLAMSPCPEPRQIDLPTIYGGEDGPDLEDLASMRGMTVEEVIRRHSGAVYTVYMMGFSPGFAYLGGLPPELATPRMETPRTLVKAGSVGIAGNQTGVYPLDSPGGWRIIGHTAKRLFDLQADPPTLLLPGDRVRFIPYPSTELSGDDAGY